MPADRFVTYESGPSRSRVYLLWVLPVAVLVGAWLWLAFWSGGRQVERWAIPALVLGAGGCAVAWIVGFPRRPRQLSMTVLALFAAYGLWTLASNLWATDAARSWPAAGRNLLYVLVLALALAYFTSPNARVMFRYLLMTTALALLVVCIWRLWSASDLTGLLSLNRLVYPIGYADSNAALFLVLFWPLLWLAAGPREPAPLRGVALGLATGLVGLAVMTQSRGAVWSLAVSLVIVFALSPGRQRLLFFLVIPGLLMVYAYPHLERYWTQDPAVASGGLAARTLVVSAAAAGFIGMICALLEKWVKISGRMKVIFGTVILLGCVGGLVYGALTLTADLGGPVVWFENAWHRLASEPAAGDQSLTDPAGAAETANVAAPATRSAVWEDGWRRIQGSLVLGVGAGDSPGAAPGGTSPDVASSMRYTPEAEPLILRVLGDSGIVGGVLAFGAIAVSVVGILWPRSLAGMRLIRRKRRRKRGPDAAPDAAADVNLAAEAAAAAKPATRRGGRRARRAAGGGAVPASIRWGSDIMTYGWQISLLAALSYWFVHANLEWLWQIPGVTFPALLMLAAALATTDARAGTLWPRLHERLRRQAERTEGQGDIGRRTYMKGRLRPEGPLSDAFRVGLLLLSATVIIVAGSSYLLALM